MVEFSGTYEHDRDEDFQVVLEKIGVGLMIRKAMCTAKPKVEVTVEDDAWTVVTVTPIKTISLTFKLDEETEMVTAEGGKKKVMFSLDGNTLIQTLVDEEEDNAFKVTREFTDDGMTLTMTHIASGTSGSRYFKRE